MTQPLDRTCNIPPAGDLDSELGEFWVENPFLMPQQGYNLSAFERNRIFVNHEGQRFLDASFSSNADLDADSRSTVVGDFDRDGAPDLLVASVGGGPLRLFQNRCRANNRIRVELTGVASNVRGIGSRVTVKCEGRTITRDIFPSNSFMGQSPPELVIGVGSAKRIDELTIRWPLGSVESYRDLPVNCRLIFSENARAYQIEKLLP